MLSLITCLDCGNNHEVEDPQFEHYFKWMNDAYYCCNCGQRAKD